VHLPDGYQLFHHEVLESTNDTAKAMAREGMAHGSVIVADHQSRGRGRRGNQWTSFAGNLYISLILRETIAVKHAGQLSFLAAVALADAVSPLLKPDCRLEQKWPNDVWLNGGKLAGILLESESLPSGGLDWLVIGMGVNVSAAPDDGAILKGVTLSDISAQEIAEQFLIRLTKRLVEWRADGFSPVRKAWLAKARGLESRITVRLPRSEVHGIFKGIDEDGCLILDTDNGQQKIASGDVFFG
jgi:BirA family biotin operon repressor/biotin-[acetyl-CoA-carboxylase] ligase